MAIETFIPGKDASLESTIATMQSLQGRALGSLENVPGPGCDMEKITLASNLEIRSIDSSGVISWNFPADAPDYPFTDWNFSATTAETTRGCANA